jgi:DNA-binding LytR/AlgR family response regulator
MPGKNGFHVLKAVMAMDNPPLAVFVTAFDQYAIRA